MHKMKRIISALLAVVIILQLTACGFSSDIVRDIGEKASDIANSASDEIVSTAEKAKNAISNLSVPDFKRGFDTAAEFFGSTVASIGGSSYVNKVADTITDLEQNIARRVSSSSIAAAAGNIAEEWHAGTYNIDAAARNSDKTATTGKSNKLGSSDISVNDELQASSKYYKDAADSAKQQAKNYFERYAEYKSKSDNPLTMEEWLKSNNIVKTDKELFWSIYKDQVRVIPSDQLKDAKACLERAIAKETAKDGTNRQYLAENDLETLKNLTDRISTSDGAKSVPLTKEQAETIAKAAQNGDFSAEEFGITTQYAISGTYVAKQALKSGATASIIEAALVIGPQIYEIIQYGIKTGELDAELLKTTGIDGLSAAGDGFLKGTVSNALVVLCQAGKLGAEYKNASPELVGTLTVLVIDAIKYGIMMGNGKLSTAAYIDFMAEEVFVGAGALGAAALVDLLFPGATLAIMIGSFVGGIVLSAGYTAGKTYAMAVIDNCDVDLLVPISTASKTIKGISSDVVMKLSEAFSNMKNFNSKAVKNITLKVYDLTSLL